MLDQATLQNALQFLGRTQLVGNEVPAFVQVTNAIHDELRRLSIIESQPPGAIPQPPVPLDPAP